MLDVSFRLVTQRMTLLQRGTIQRLREAGYNSLADAAKDAWSNGEQLRLPNLVSERAAELRADFEKANQQAREMSIEVPLVESVRAESGSATNPRMTQYQFLTE